MRSIVMVVAASALVGVGFLLGRLPAESKVSPEVRVAPQPGPVSILDMVDGSPASPPSITEQAEEAMRRNEGGLVARNLRTLSEKPGAHPSLRGLADKAQAAGAEEPKVVASPAASANAH